MNILAGSTTDLRWDKDAKGYKPAAEVPEGHTFTIQCIDFWQAQELLDTATPVLIRIKKGLEVGLVAIDGDPELAKKFLARPKATLVNPLFDEILGAAAGN